MTSGRGAEPQPTEGAGDDMPSADDASPPDAVSSRHLRPDSELSERELLARLIFGVTPTELEQLRVRVDDDSGKVQHLSDSVRAAAKDEGFKTAIAPVVALGVMDTARRKPLELGDALAPAMGPAIRAMVALALDRVRQGVEAQIQRRFTIEGLKWSLEARRTGVPVADIIVRETMVFKVDHVLLVHRSSGTLLGNVSAPDVEGKDVTALTAMLTAVCEFVADTFDDAGASGDQTFRVGEVNVAVQGIGDLALAVIVRGDVTADLRKTARETLEKCCLIYGPAAAQFDGNLEPFATSPALLFACMVSQAKGDNTSTPAPSWRSWLVKGLAAAAVLGLVAWWIVGAIAESRAEDRLAALSEALDATPGIVLVDVAEGDDDKTHVRLLVDPLTAEQPQDIARRVGVEADTIVWSSHPYAALDGPIVAKRLRTMVSAPQSVAVRVEQGVAVFSGTAPAAWIRRVEAMTIGIIGVDSVDLRAVAILNDREAAALTHGTSLEATP